MHRLILFRHAKAEGRSASGEDFDRDLTDRGRADARLIATALKDRGVRIDLALVSGARRTRSTWNEVAKVLDAGVVRFEDDLYGAPAVALLAAAERSGETGTVLVLAHNPGLHDAVMHLTATGAGDKKALAEARRSMPTSTAALFDESGELPALEAYLLARDFGGGGGE